MSIADHYRSRHYGSVREIEEARNYARGLIECSPDMMVTVNQKGLIIDVNEEGVRWNAESRAELVGNPI
jgi:hypothetical protein